MVKPIVTDELFLRRLSTPATAADVSVAQDLLDTLEANKDRCVGMAANMIGVAKRIIVVDDNGNYLLMFNPEIIKRSAPFETEESCLSLTGTRNAKRYRSVKVRYQNSSFQERIKTFKGWVGQIIQHKIDHCNGIII